MSLELGDETVARYLRLLGLERSRRDLRSLAQLTSAHLMHIPFENISKIYRRKRFGLKGLPDVEMYLDGIERFHFGGTCYANNYHLYRLLLSLGFETKLCGADMTNPDVHMVVMVTVDGREYLVDVGYGAPFHEPIPRDLETDHEVRLGRERFVLQPQDEQGRSRMVMYRGGLLKHGYVAKPEARGIEHFKEIIRRSLELDALFMNAVLMVRQWPGQSVVIHNTTLIESRGEKWTLRGMAGREELVAEIEQQFGMQEDIVREAVGELSELRDAWT